MFKTKYEKSLLALLFIAIIFCVSFFYQDYKIRQELKLKELRHNAKIIEIKNKLEVLPLEAKAISVYDVTSNEKLYGKNDTIPLSLASLVKVMTVLVALQGNDSSEEVTISQNALKEVGDNSLYAGEKWNKEDLAKFTLIMSSNDGAFALAENDSNFLQKMNEKAQKLGLDNMSFLNVSGLDIDKQLFGAVGTAEEMNSLIILALRAQPEIFKSTREKEVIYTSLSGLQHNVLNTNIIVDKIPNLIFSKTGATDLTGGNLSIVFVNKEKHEIAVTVLGSSILGRFTDMEKIVEVLYNISNED